MSKRKGRKVFDSILLSALISNTLNLKSLEHDVKLVVSSVISEVV